MLGNWERVVFVWRNSEVGANDHLYRIASHSESFLDSRPKHNTRGLWIAGGEQTHFPLRDVQYIRRVF